MSPDIWYLKALVDCANIIYYVHITVCNFYKFFLIAKVSRLFLFLFFFETASLLSWKKFTIWAIYELSGNEPPTIRSPKYDLRDPVCVSCALRCSCITTLRPLHHVHVRSRNEKAAEIPVEACELLCDATGVHDQESFEVKWNTNLQNVRLHFFSFSMINDLCINE